MRPAALLLAALVLSGWAGLLATRSRAAVVAAHPAGAVVVARPRLVPGGAVWPVAAWGGR